MRQIIIIMIIAVGTISTSGCLPWITSNNNTEYITVVNRTKIDKQGSLVILPTEERVLVKKSAPADDKYISAYIPAVLSGEMAVESNIKMLLPMVEAEYPLRQIVIICNSNQGAMIQSIYTNKSFQIIIQQTDKIKVYIKE